MIMDTFVHPSEPVFFSDEDFQNLPELAQKAQQINPDCDPKQDEAEILQLLDKFYNGDRELPPASRYKNKETYKHMLIQKFRRWGSTANGQFSSLFSSLKINSSIVFSLSTDFSPIISKIS